MDPIQTTQLDRPGDIIDLGIGQPSPWLLPLEVMNRRRRIDCAGAPICWPMAMNRETAIFGVSWLVF